nr:immunoglobulin heavy chain junction region [Mus musculus]MBK4185670.1 immunoglobulin heavy chain junction region [Mus musculus]
CARWIGYFDYW